jgi:hypothetical protein
LKFTSVYQIWNNQGNDKMKLSLILFAFAFSCSVKFNSVPVQADLKVFTERQIMKSESQDEIDFDSRSSLEKHFFKRELKDFQFFVSATGRYSWVLYTGEGVHKPAMVAIFEIAEDFSSMVSIHRFNLLNPVAPMFSYLTSDGKYFVTFDEQGRCGNSPRDLVIYDLENEKHTQLSVDDMFDAEVVKNLRGPVHMGGIGLREWSRPNRQGIQYDAENQILYPTSFDQSSLNHDPTKTTHGSRVPYIAIELRAGRVTVLNKPFEKSEDTNLSKNVIAQNFHNLSVFGEMANSIRVSHGEPIDYLAVVDLCGQLEETDRLKLAYRYDSTSDKYLRVDWKEFEKVSSQLHNILK